MKRYVIALLAAAAGALCLAGCSPASGFNNQEDRWTANQSTQPVGYAKPAAAQSADEATTPTASEPPVGTTTAH